MGRTAQRVEDLVDEDPAMAGAIQTVLDTARENGGEVEWSDVRGDITSGQWGRLIEKGILEDGTEGFRLASESDVEEALSDEDTSVDASTSGDDEEDEGWRTIDKAAAAVAVTLILGYNYAPIRNTVGGAIDLVLGPVANVLPFYGVILLAALITGVVSVLVQGNMMDSQAMAGQQEKVQELKERRKKAQEAGDEEELEKINKEQMELMQEQFGNFAQNFRPMVWTMTLSIPIFLWMYWQLRSGDVPVVPDAMVMPMLGEVKWNQGVHNMVPFPAWIVWYFVCSMSLSQLIRKALNIQTTPT
jgi:uncharacterized membrane protein (DUF106 family)